MSLAQAISRFCTICCYFAGWKFSTIFMECGFFSAYASACIHRLITCFTFSLSAGFSPDYFIPGNKGAWAVTPVTDFSGRADYRACQPAKLRRPVLFETLMKSDTL